MENKVILSKKFTLKMRDHLRGLYMAVGTAMAVVIQTSIDAGELEFKWKQIAMAGVGSGVLYLLKNLFLEPTKVITVTPTIQEGIKVTQDIKEIV